MNASLRPGRILGMASRAGRFPEVLRCIRECKNWSQAIPGYLGLGGPPYPYRFETRSGESLVVERFEDLVTAWIIFIRRDYPVDAGCRTIVDAGANIGAFTLFAARSAPEARVIALEPFPSTFDRLRDHVRESPGRERIECLNRALCGSDGARAMDDSPRKASQFRGVLDGSAGQPGVAVEAMTLPALMEQGPLERIDLLKLDIEGSEYEVIESTPPEFLRRIREIVMEYHPNGSKHTLFGKLADAGFEVVRDSPSPGGYGLAHLRLRSS